MGETGILEPTDRVERIAGEIIDMSPIGSMHAALVDVLARHLGRRAAESVFIRCQNPLRLDHLSEPEPDIALLRPRADLFTTSHPGPDDVLLVIEIADPSLAYDIGTKVPLYARHGIPEQLLFDARGGPRIRPIRECRDPAPVRRETLPARFRGSPRRGPVARRRDGAVRSRSHADSPAAPSPHRHDR